MFLFGGLITSYNVENSGTGTSKQFMEREA